MKIKIAEQSASVVGDILYIELPKSKITPAYAAEIIERRKCKSICFNNSKRVYRLDNLKGKEDWKDVN